MTKSILDYIGLVNRNGKTNGNKESDHRLASRALVHLIESGKLSIHEVIDAVDAISDEFPEINPVKTNKRETKESKVSEKYRTRHVALQFSYDGTSFTGFAQNIGKDEDNSVEKALFAALEKTRMLLSPELVDFSIRSDGPADDGKGEMSARTASKYSRCGRTDKGVHANGQVVALYIKSAFPLGAKLSESSNAGKEPGKLLDDDDLPKNSLNGLECFVPKRNKSKQNSGINPLELKTITELDYPRILNNVLPPSIRVLGWCPVSPEFSARFSCSQRTYRYFFPRRNLDLKAMADGLANMIGKHDFRNLCKMNCEQVYNFERKLVEGKVMSPHTVYIIEQSTDEDGLNRRIAINESLESSPLSSQDMCYVEIVGQAFLWHQIRCIMSILFLIGRGLESPAVVKELLDIATNPAKPSYEMASENALVLQDCTFANLTLGSTVKNLWDVTKVIETRWEKHAIAAERARDLIETVKSEEVSWTDLVAFIEQIAKEKRRKEQKRDGVLKTAAEENIDELMKQYISDPNPPEMLSWRDAIEMIEKVLGVYPHLPNGVNETTKGLTESTIHTPLMKRDKGTTYEEKVQAILGDESNGGGKPSKRKERYEENIIKKRKTSEEDKAFYDHMLKQGGSSV